MTEPQTRIHDTELEKALALHRRRVKIVRALETLKQAELKDVEYGNARSDSRHLYAETEVSVSRYGEAVMAAVRAEVQKELEWVEHELCALGISLSTAGNL